MFDIDKIKQSASKLATNATNRFKQYAPEAVVSEKKFAHALADAFALMVIADQKIETEEVEAVMKFLNGIDEIKKLELERLTIERFESSLNTLANSVFNSTAFIIEKSKMLADIGKIKSYPAYRSTLLSVLEHVAGADGNVSKSEVEMKKEIMEVL